MRLRNYTSVEVDYELAINKDYDTAYRNIYSRLPSKGKRKL